MNCSYQFLSIDVNTYRLIKKKFATPTLTFHAHSNVHKNLN